MASSFVLVMSQALFLVDRNDEIFDNTKVLIKKRQKYTIGKSGKLTESVVCWTKGLTAFLRVLDVLRKKNC